MFSYEYNRMAGLEYNPQWGTVAGTHCMTHPYTAALGQPGCFACAWDLWWSHWHLQPIPMTTLPACIPSRKRRWGGGRPAQPSRRLRPLEPAGQLHQGTPLAMLLAAGRQLRLVRPPAFVDLQSCLPVAAAQHPPHRAAHLRVVTRCRQGLCGSASNPAISLIQGRAA